MAEITIVPSVRLYKTGLKTTQADGNVRSIALQQGSLDGACAVYSTIITLMCLRQINYEEVSPEYIDSIDKRSPKGKFLSKLLEQRGMNLAGWNLKTMAQEINNTSDFNVKATAVRKDYVERVYDSIHKGTPCLMSIKFTRTGQCHAIVCVGVEESDEYEETAVKLFCIDPSDPMPFTAYWNSVIMLPKEYDDNTEFNYVVESQIFKVEINDTIVFD